MSMSFKSVERLEVFDDATIRHSTASGIHDNLLIMAFVPQPDDSFLIPIRIGILKYYCCSWNFASVFIFTE
jgi:hypothetical protein